MKHLHVTGTLALALIVGAGCGGAGDSAEGADPSVVAAAELRAHPDYASAAAHGAAWGAYRSGAEGARDCRACHGTDLQGRGAAVSCSGCHAPPPVESGTSVEPGTCVALGGQPAFAVHSHGMAVDGANLWVSTASANTVTKVDARDGTVRGVYSFGASPRGVVFDGAYVWVANAESDTITKVSPADGRVVSTVSVEMPWVMAFDGANLWVTNYYFFAPDWTQVSSVTKVRASDGAVLGTYPVGVYPTGIAFDGADVWVASTNGPGVYELRASDGERLGGHAIGSNPDAVAFDGVNVWVGDYWGGVYKVSADGGAVLDHYEVSEVGLVTTVAFDGAHVWVAGYSGIVKLDPANGAVLALYSVPYAQSLAFAGGTAWAAVLAGTEVCALGPVAPTADGSP